MTFVLPVVRIAFAVVFSVSGLAKLLDLAGTRQSLREFGSPEPLVSAGAVGLPILELLVAAALTATGTAQVAAAAALVLLAGFTVAIGYQLARGGAPRCNCFGPMSGDAVGWNSIVRNAVLIAVAVIILLAPHARSGIDSAGWLAATTTAERLSLGISLAALIIFLLLWHGLADIRRQQRQMLTLVEGLRIRLDGVPVRPVTGHVRAARNAPAFRLSNLDGTFTSLDDLLSDGRRVLLLFVDPQCSPCDGVLAQVSTWHSQHNVAEIAVISRGSAADNWEKATAHELRPVLLQRDREVAEAYDVHGTPCMVAVGPDRRTAGLSACGQQSITALLDQVTRDTTLTGPHAHYRSSKPITSTAELATQQQRPVGCQNYAWTVSCSDAPQVSGRQ